MDAYSSIALVLWFFIVFLTGADIVQNSEYGELLYKKSVMFHDLIPYSTLLSICNVVYGIVKLGLVFGMGYVFCSSSLSLYAVSHPDFRYVAIAMHILFLVAAIIFDLFTTFKKSLAKNYFRRKILFAAGMLLYTLFVQFILPQLVFSFPDSI